LPVDRTVEIHSLVLKSVGGDRASEAAEGRRVAVALTGAALEGRTRDSRAPGRSAHWRGSP
jgi:hypothetical protein